MDTPTTAQPFMGGAFVDATMKRILDLAARTVDAYSADCFGAVGWTECAALLVERGYNDEEAEAILRSKWTRWARDMSPRKRGKYRGADLARFIDGAKNAEPGGAAVRAFME